MERHVRAPWREKLFRIIFESDTPAGRTFDVALLWAIIASVVAVCLDSVESIRERFQTGFLVLEWAFTVFFTIEYVLRILTVRRPLRYVLSFYGLVDLLAILPSYLSLFFPGSQRLLVIRVLRLLRVFRIFKLGRFVSESQVLLTAIRGSGVKITVFLFVVMTLVVVVGALMYLIEGPTRGFTSIPVAMYWAIVTVTTVGYGDITPQTVLGQVLSSMLMIVGYGVIAIPTGIVTAELTSAVRSPNATTRTCPACVSEGHRIDAQFCRDCGARLPPLASAAPLDPVET